MARNRVRASALNAASIFGRVMMKTVTLTLAMLAGMACTNFRVMKRRLVTSPSIFQGPVTMWTSVGLTTGIGASAIMGMGILVGTVGRRVIPGTIPAIGIIIRANGCGTAITITTPPGISTIMRTAIGTIGSPNTRADLGCYPRSVRMSTRTKFSAPKRLEHQPVSRLRLTPSSSPQTREHQPNDH